MRPTPGVTIHSNRKLPLLMEFPLTFGVIGAVLVPTLAAVGALAALVSEATIVVEKNG